MKKTNQLVVAATIGAAGILALGACSSGNNQGQESSSPSVIEPSTTETARDAAPADHSDHVKVPGSKGGQYNDVVLTHNAQAKCTRSENKGNLVIECSNVGHNVAGDAVYVRVPSKMYMVNVENLSYDKGLAMTTTQRDHAASAYAHQNTRRDQYWSAPDLWTAKSGWGVGVESRDFSDRISVKITVTKDD